MRIYIKFHGGRVTLIGGNTGGGRFLLGFRLFYLPLSSCFSFTLSVRFGPIFVALHFV